MIKFAFKSLVMLALVGHAIKLVEPVEPATANPGFVPAAYLEGQTASGPDVTQDLSTFTNAQIVVSHAARDAVGFCDREPLACRSGRELTVRLATGIRDIAASAAHWARAEESGTPAVVDDGGEGEYHPLANYRGSYPIFPETPPARGNTF
jgi:hypothetical protein